MTEDELIAAERRAVDQLHFSQAERDRLYAKMRAHSLAIPNRNIPNDVRIDDAWPALCLRAKDLAGVAPETGFYLPPRKR